jgi:hypothetical protein
VLHCSMPALRWRLHLMVFSFPNALLPTPNAIDVWVRREVSAAVEVELTTNTLHFRLHDASRQGAVLCRVGTS